MFDHLFENRNSTVTNLLKLGDCLARSLRENIELFSTVVPASEFDKGDWIFQDSKGSPDIDESDKIEIMKNLYPANAWIDQKLMRSL